MFYERLFELNIFHNYYQDKVCPDLSIEPTTECSRLLSGHRLIVKNKGNAIVVIAPVDSEQKPWIKLADNLRFTFILKLKNKDFIDFTDIDWKPVDDRIYQFSNEKNTQIGVSDIEITQTKLSDRKLPRGQNIFGIVDIYNNSSMPKILNQSSEYQITFQAKKQQWCYYVITDGVTNGDELLIQDEGKARRESNKITFTRVTSAEAEKTDAKFSVLNQQFPQSQQYLFQSNSEIPCQEVGRKNIQLLKKKASGSTLTVLIEHLPSPPNHNGIQVINALKYL